MANTSSGRKKQATKENITQDTADDISKIQKRKCCVVTSTSEESELEDPENNNAIDKKIQTIAINNNLNSDDMKLLIDKVPKNDHVLALITIKPEDELAREKREQEQRAIIITDTPSLPKLTRSKARELNKAPVIALPPLVDENLEFVSLIQEDFHSDEDDEEYTFQEEDFISDDDHTTAASDLDSHPPTPKTPKCHIGTDSQNNSNLLTPDGCFKIPHEIHNDESNDMRIATRTRSKLCLEKTTIEDLQSEFIPPDVERCEIQETDINDVWTEFLNEFSKPLNNLIGDDDDVNDPEYVAAEKITLDAEELRDANISKKELNDLVTELFEGLVAEGVSFENFESGVHNDNDFNEVIAPKTVIQSPPPVTPSKQLPLKNETDKNQQKQSEQADFHGDDRLVISDDTISSTNSTRIKYTFNPNIVSTPSNNAHTSSNYIFENIPESTQSNQNVSNVQYSKKSNDILLFDETIENEYLPVRRFIRDEHIQAFESLKNTSPVRHSFSTENTGFTEQQYQIFQQQLRIHVQFLAQNFMQTYCHPGLWKLAPKAKDMMHELVENAKENYSFNAFNLYEAKKLITDWEVELSAETDENRDLMNFMHKQISRSKTTCKYIPRFHERVMKRILNSPVFMYPEYLPRMAFRYRKKIQKYYTSIAPSETLLIAMGLEHHVNAMSNEKSIRPSSKFVVACELMANRTVLGKSKRRIWNYVKYLREVSYYNPIKYYFDHKCAPPVRHNVVYLDLDNILPPKDRVKDLPPLWREYVKKRSFPAISANVPLRENYAKIVLETIGEDIANIQPQSSLVPVENRTCTQTSNVIANATVSHRKSTHDNSYKKIETENRIFAGAPEIITISDDSINQSNVSERISTGIENTSAFGIEPQSVIFNVNYVFGSNILTNFPGNSICLPINDASTSNNTNLDSLQCEQLSINCEQPSSPVITKLPQPSPNKEKQRKLTDYFSIQSKNSNVCSEIVDQNKPIERKSNKTLKPISHRILFNQRIFISRRDLRLSLNYRQTKRLQKRYKALITTYKLHLQTIGNQYSSKPLIQYIYRHFNALELYTELLKELKMNCRYIAGGNLVTTTNNKKTKSTVSTVAQSHQNDDESTNSNKVKKNNRQEENVRHMLLPDNAEDANRKDAIFAFNFYEKAEEVLKSSKRPDDCKKFNHILKSFNPKRDKVADLYHKLENLFLPDHPELAQVFLTFLLPSEAAEVGKFFEHFMYKNMSTFINKLNVYFNKQPAQIRKVYGCLNELSEESDVTIEKVKSKIIPLLRGNQFMIDWFLQLFPTEPPPERLLTSVENINLKEVMNHCGEYVETLVEMMDPPGQEQQQTCQLKYINGRIFYGSKIALPAKLSFMATSYGANELPCTDMNEDFSSNSDGCIHGIRACGENRLSLTSDENEKLEDDDPAKLIIDDAIPGIGEVVKIELCDDTGLRAHAVRLNPSFYGTTCFSTNTPNPSVQQTHNRKTLQLTVDELKISPRKHLTSNKLIGASSTASSTTTATINSISTSGTSSTSFSNHQQTTTSSTSNSTFQREKRKSPIKKCITQAKSPLNGKRSNVNHQQNNIVPMVVVHAQLDVKSNAAIATAKKLRNLVDDSEIANDAEDDNRKLASTIFASAKKRKIDQSIVVEEVVAGRKCNEIDSNKDNQTDGKLFANETDKKETDIECHPSNHNSKDDNENKKQLSEEVKTEISASPSGYVAPWTRDEDKIILIEMKINSSSTEDLIERINCKLPSRDREEIVARHKFLMDFLSKLQNA